ncbi:MAG: rhomboid family intramembrane serine protease [Bdellovibrionales bacterium]|nr:rhomboid family intramembrane serine protease [Bdellovibrionales bacterium]
MDSFAAQSSSSVLRETLLSRKPNPLAPVAMAMATLVVVLLSIAAWTDFAGAEEWMRASRDAVFSKHQYWKAWTTLFVHGDGKHLLSNSFLFFILGTFLTGYFGITRVLLSALIFGGLTNLYVLQGMPAEVHLIGLSGVVFWMGGAWLILYFMIDRKRTLMHRFLRAMGVGLLLFMPAEAFDASISYESHFVGFILGIIAGLLYFYFNKKSLREAEIYEAAPIEDESAAVF